MSKLIVKGADFSYKSVGRVDVSEMRYAPTNGAIPPQGMKNFIKIKNADFSQNSVRKIGKLNAPIMHYDGKQKVTIEYEKGAELWVCDWSPAYNETPTYPTNYYQVEGTEDGIVELGMDTNNHYQFRRYAKQIVNGIESPITYIDVCQTREIKGECDIDGNVLDTFKSTSYIYPTYLSSAYVKDEGYKPSVIQEQVVKLDDGKYMYSIHQVWEQCKFTTDGSDPRTSNTAQTKFGIGLLGITLQPNDVVKVVTLSPLGIFSKVVTYTFPQRITAHGYNPTDGYIVNHTDNVLVGVNPQTNSNGNMMWYWADLVSYDSEEGIALRKPTEDCELFAMIRIDNIYSNIAKKSIIVTKSPTITIDGDIATITPNYGNFGSTEGIKTYYSIDGSEPSILYTEPITLTEDCVVKAKTEMYIDSGVFTEVVSEEYISPVVYTDDTNVCTVPIVILNNGYMNWGNAPAKSVRRWYDGYQAFTSSTGGIKVGKIFHADDFKITVPNGYTIQLMLHTNKVHGGNEIVSSLRQCTTQLVFTPTNVYEIMMEEKGMSKEELIATYPYFMISYHTAPDGINYVNTASRDKFMQLGGKVEINWENSIDPSVVDPTAIPSMAMAMPMSIGMDEPMMMNAPTQFEVSESTQYILDNSIIVEDEGIIVGYEDDQTINQVL